jgi:hypothetical protein
MYLILLYIARKMSVSIDKKFKVCYADKWLILGPDTWRRVKKILGTSILQMFGPSSAGWENNKIAPTTIGAILLLRNS